MVKLSQTINILGSETIDKIAAGEVVERPSNIVKELVENAIDAGSKHITVEIKEGGISFIRVTDDGSGISKSELEKAFMRHATSKILTASDLDEVMSLGFRGEALSSISAVSQVEMITKTRDSFLGTKINVNGSQMSEMTDVGSPDGTTVIVRNVFYNTPVRKKFLKTPMTEGGYISDMMQHIALSRPDVAIKFINSGQTKFFTAGNGDLKDVIYRIWGKDTMLELIPITSETDGISVKGFLGKPILNRSNRNFETIFVNGRFVKSKLISSAIEEGYKGYMMQHKYPFVVLHITIDPNKIDVNVHPTKMDIRILSPEAFVRFVTKEIHEVLLSGQMIPELKETENTSKKEQKQAEKTLTGLVPEPFEQNRRFSESKEEKPEINSETKPEKKSSLKDAVLSKIQISQEDDLFELDFEETSESTDSSSKIAEQKSIVTKQPEIIVEKQETLFDDSIMNYDKDSAYEIIGQLFDTYWVVSFHDKVYFIDQHAAHEKVKYERFVKQLHEKEITTQILSPAAIVPLSAKEMAVYNHYADSFAQVGFVIEEFGSDCLAIREVPTDLYGVSEKELFLSILDELDNYPGKKDSELILDRIATMACKAAVKGNTKLSHIEAKALIDELLTLENPFQCPHGRPTIVSMTKYEMEKKFKRIL